MIDFNNLPIEGVFKFDIEDIAHTLQFSIGDKLLPPPEGIFIFNKLEPVIVTGQQCYVDTNFGKQPLIDINQHNTTVYDADDKVIIPALYMQEKEKFISNHPFLPYRGLHILKAIVQDEVYSKLHHMDYDYPIDEEIKQHLQNVTDKELDEIIEKAYHLLRHLRNDIEEFIGKDNWHIYYVNVDKRHVIIEKNIDFRIYEWHKMKEEQKLLSLKTSDQL